MVIPPSNSVKASDIDPQRLAKNTSLTDEQKISEASRQFEAILLRQILSSTQKPVITSKLSDNSTASEIYRDMITNQLADAISKSGAFGIAKTFEHQLTTHKKSDSAAIAPLTTGSLDSVPGHARPALALQNKTLTQMHE